MSSDWQIWIATNLLRRVEPAILVEKLIARGLAPADARRMVDDVVAHPILRAAEPFADTLRRREASLAIRGELAALVPAEIERVAAITVEHYAANRPVVTRVAPRALGWTFDGLARDHGALDVEVQRGRDAGDYQRDFDRFCSRTTLRDLIAMTREPGNGVYLTAKNLLFAQPGADVLLADLAPLPSCFEPPTPSTASMWLGPAGTHTPLHHDWMNVAIVQIAGTKAVTLVPPTEAAVVQNVDSRFADASSPRAVVIELGPGDALFVPVGWFHEVRALERSISVSLTGFIWPNRFDWNTDTSR